MRISCHEMMYKQNTGVWLDTISPNIGWLSALVALKCCWRDFPTWNHIYTLHYSCHLLSYPLRYGHLKAISIEKFWFQCALWGAAIAMPFRMWIYSMCHVHSRKANSKRNRTFSPYSLFCPLVRHDIMGCDNPTQSNILGVQGTNTYSMTRIINRSRSTGYFPPRRIYQLQRLLAKAAQSLPLFRCFLWSSSIISSYYRTPW